MPVRAWTRDGFLHFCSWGIMRFLLFSLLLSECYRIVATRIMKYLTLHYCVKVCKYTKCLMKVPTRPHVIFSLHSYCSPEVLRVTFHGCWCLLSSTVHSETEMTYSLQILLELEMDMKGSGANPFASLKPEVVGSCPNKPPVYCNSHYFCFQGLLETVEFEEPEEAWRRSFFFSFFFDHANIVFECLCFLIVK